MPANSPQLSRVKRPPKYSRQKEKNRADRAYVFLDGKKVLLGTYKSPESIEKYNALFAESAVTDFLPSDNPTVNELLVAYLEHAAIYYRKTDGTVAEEYNHLRRVAGILRNAVGKEPAKDIGPKRLKAIREGMIAKGWARSHLNDQVKRIVRIFRYGASEEMIPAAVSDALRTVEGLRKGRSNAKESRIVRAVDDKIVEATLKHLPQVVADMVRVQRLTGMRPGEMIAMRPCDIDRSADVWLYSPEHHKTEHRGHSRIIAIGPKCQEILLRYLARDAGSCCFQPQDSEDKRRAARSAERIVPLSCGNSTGSNRKELPQRTAGESYSTDSYRRAIERAAKKAGVEVWTPHRLRHAAATEVRRKFGLDSCQAILGHRHASVSEIYAELNTAKAAEVAAKIG